MTAQEVTFRWETAAYSRSNSALICDVKGGRLYVRRAYHGSRWFDVLWNARHVGVGENVEEAKTLAEQLYKEGLL